MKPIQGAIATEYHNREDWLAARAKTIGASDVGVILGLPAFDTVYELWARKLGKIESKGESFRMWWGSKNENNVSEWYTKTTGRELVDFGDFTIHSRDDFPSVSCTLDRVWFDEEGKPVPVELKVSEPFDASAWADGGAPELYKAQLQTQMAIIGAERGVIAAVVRGEFEIREFDAIPDFLSTIQQPLDDFMQLLKTETEPPVTSSDIKSWEQVHLNTTDEILEMDSETIALVASLQQDKAKAKIAEASIKEKEARLKSIIGDHSGAIGGDFKISYPTITRKSTYTVEPNRVDELRQKGYTVKQSGGSSYRRMSIKTRSKK